MDQSLSVSDQSVPDIYCCPVDKTALTKFPEAYKCQLCGSIYQVDGDSPVFTKSRGYWSNVSREVMATVIERTRHGDDWREVVRAEMPLYERHIAPLFRGDIRVVIPISRSSRILDAGSMWGGVSMPLAPFCGQLFALDQTWESLQFLHERATQDGHFNVKTVEGSVRELPFIDQTFDIVILNGVLEWLATEDEVILERDWENAALTTQRAESTRDPMEMQLEGLKEIFRVLKDEGSLYVAIENRIGLQYFAGYPDDHVNIRFVSFLPRFLSNFITKLIKNHSYRTYLYSPEKLAGLLRSAGFQHVEIYSSAPHYNIISRLVSFNDFSSVERLARTGGAPLDKGGKLKVALFGFVWSLIPESFAKHLCPSISVVASKDKKATPSLIDFMIQEGILPDEEYGVMIINNRFDDDLPMICLTRSRTTGDITHFCKVARKKGTANLGYESQQLIAVHSLLVNTALAGSVPSLIFTGEMGGAEVQITEYRSIKSVEPRVLSNLLKHSRQKYIVWISNLGLAPLLRGWYFRRVGRATEDASEWLANFHIATSNGREGSDDLVLELLDAIEVMNVEESTKQAARESLDALSLTGVSVNRVTEHGDFDYCNIFYDEKKTIFVADFEHAQQSQLPFFDLGTLLLSNLATEWLSLSEKPRLRDFARTSGWQDVIDCAVLRYSKTAGMDINILRGLPLFVAIRQFSKPFPSSRNPKDYPLFDKQVCDELINWHLDID